MESAYTEAIKKLVRQHYDHEITTEDYRISRRRLIDKMDQEFNGNEFSNKTEELRVPQNQI
jgi:hemoglobin-like flavoprotein